MKKALMRITRPLSRVSVELGEKFAWWLFLAMAGFIAGWMSAHWKWLGMICLPAGVYA